VQAQEVLTRLGMQVAPATAPVPTHQPQQQQSPSLPTPSVGPQQPVIMPAPPITLPPPAQLPAAVDGQQPRRGPGRPRKMPQASEQGGARP
jgi:hypothetical protein